jgi:hypothetical protein
MWVFVQIAGFALMVLGAQGAIRLLADHADAGLVSWVPGGLTGWLVADLVTTVVGVALLWWGQARSKAGAQP